MPKTVAGFWVPGLLFPAAWYHPGFGVVGTGGTTQYSPFMWVLIPPGAALEGLMGAEGAGQVSGHYGGSRRDLISVPSAAGHCWVFEKL